MPDRGEKSGIGGEALARRNRRGAGQRAGRIGRASKAQVEISLALQERDRLAGGIATHQNGSPIRQRRVPQLEGAAPVASQGPGGTEKLPRCSQRLLLVGAADREHQRLGVLWNGEERDAFLRVESVCFRGARVEHVESRASAERPRELVERRSQRQLGGDLAVDDQSRPRRGDQQRGARVPRHRHGHGSLQRGDVRPRRAHLAVLVANGLDDGVDACARECVDDGRALPLRGPVAEVPEDLGSFRHLLRLAEAERNAGVRRPGISGIGRDPLHAGQQDEQAEEQASPHARRVYHTALAADADDRRRG